MISISFDNALEFNNSFVLYFKATLAKKMFMKYCAFISRWNYNYNNHFDNFSSKYLNQ